MSDLIAALLEAFSESARQPRPATRTDFTGLYWRAFLMDGTVLEGPYGWATTLWKPGAWVEASCPLAAHAPPAAGCACGLYAVTSRDALVRWARKPLTTLAGPLALLFTVTREGLIAPVELETVVSVPPNRFDPPGTVRAARGRIPADVPVWAAKLHMTQARRVGFPVVRPMSELLAPYKRRRAATR